MVHDGKPSSQREKTQKFNRMFFWGMILALLAILMVYFLFAFTRQARLGHGQADPNKQSLVVWSTPATA